MPYPVKPTPADVKSPQQKLERISWAEVRKHPFSPGGGPDEWPPDVQPVSMQGLSLLGIDKSFKLYWDGQPLQLASRLAWPERLFAGVGAASGLIIAGVQIAKFFGLGAN